MPDLITTLHPINDDTTDLYPNVKNENIPPVVSGKDAMEALEGEFSTLKTDEIQVGGENGTLINKDQIATPNKVINLDEIVDDAELAQALNGKVDKVQGKGLSTNDFTDAYKTELDNLPTDLNGKVDKVPGKGLSTNDYTNADKNAVEVAIPLKISFLNTNILDLYRMVIRSGGMITVTDASVALTSQTFPLTVSPKALLNYVGGMCQKVGDSIITAPVTTVVSKGFNQWDEEWEVGIYDSNTGAKGAGASDRIRCKNMISVIGGSTYFFKAPNHPQVLCYDKNGDFIPTSEYSWPYAPNLNANSTFKVPDNCRFITFFINSSSYGTTYKGDVCINVSNASLNGTYMPYSAPVYYPIHRSILALDGYGLGKDAEHYNYIDFERKMFVKETAIDGDDIIVLATPVETDISDLLRYTFPTYDIINVLPGGYLEFENENNIGVPYSVTYQSKPNMQATVLSTAHPTISEVDSYDPTDTL